MANRLVLACGWYYHWCTSQNLSLEWDCPRRGTVKQVWNAAAKTAKPLRCFSTKPDTIIMGIIEGYHTNLGCWEEKGAKTDRGCNVHVFVCRVNTMFVLRWNQLYVKREYSMFVLLLCLISLLLLALYFQNICRS